MMSQVWDIGNRVVAACDAEDEYVLSDIDKYGLTAYEMVILYKAVSDDNDNDELQGPACIICTAWLHAARLLVSQGAAKCSVAEVEGILKMADNVMSDLGGRHHHPKDGSIVSAVRGCLDLGKSLRVSAIDDIIKHFMCYGDMRE